MDVADYNPAYDGRMIFLPNLSQLCAGDIILTCAVESRDRRAHALAQRVTEATGSIFSHALICTSPPTFAEAGSEGVSAQSLLTCFVHSLENVRVLRYPDKYVAGKAAALAQLGIGREYSFRQAMQSVSKDDSIVVKISDNGTFCSAFVGQAFVTAGAEEFTATPIERTTPGTLECMGCLIDVTDRVFRPALAPRNVERMNALDGDRVPTPSSPQTEIFNRYSKAVLPLADRLVNDFPEARLERQTTYFGMLNLILAADRVCPDIPQPRQEHFSKAIGELDGALAEQQADGAIEQVLAEIQESDDRQIQRDLKETFSATPDIDVITMRDYYETRRTAVSARQRALDSMRIGRDRSAIEYHCKVQEESIRNSTQSLKAMQEILRRLGHPVD